MPPTQKNTADSGSTPDKEARKPGSEEGGETVTKETGKKVSKKAGSTVKRKTAKKAAPKKAKTNVKKAATRKKTSSKAMNRRTPAPRKASAEGNSSDAASESIHCTLALTGKWSMVLPTSAIAEITDYAPPSPLVDAPAWLLGQVEWEDWQVPVISYGALIDDAPPESATAQSRIMVVKSLSSTSRVPFIGVMVREIPRLANITPSQMEATEDDKRTPGVHCKVKFSGQEAVIPDLDRLSQLVGHAAYGTVDKDGQVAQA